MVFTLGFFLSAIKSSFAITLLILDREILLPMLSDKKVASLFNKIGSPTALSPVILALSKID